MQRLISETIQVSHIDSLLETQLFTLFSGHCPRLERSYWESELAQTEFILVLRDAMTFEVRGFSAQRVLRSSFNAQPMRAIYPSLTVMNRAPWTEEEFVQTWCRFAGRILVSDHSKLYWLLSARTHRTYLYLPLLFHDYIPHPSGEPDLYPAALRDAFASQVFGDRWDPDHGIVHHSGDHVRFAPAFSETHTTTHFHGADVEYFVRANPGHLRGDELVCFAEISPENIHLLPGRNLSRGMTAGPFTLPVAA